MKKILFTFILLITFFNSNAQIVNIPDANFKAYLVNNNTINTNGDSEIQVSEATAYNDEILVSNLNISDMTGIEAFTNLQFLYCDNNAITTLDLSNNTALIDAICNDNQLNSLNVSGCVNLTTLHCQNNQLTSLNLSTNINLLHLRCKNNQLTALDFTNNIHLNTILCQGNQLTHLDTSMTAWTVLDCSNNDLIYLKVSNGNNGNYEFFKGTSNYLVCVTVDDPSFSQTHWISNVDPYVEFSTNCTACIIGISDMNFKNYLVTNPLINVNGDGEIQCSEAHAFTGTIDANNLSIADLGGIEEFWRLTVLNVTNNQLKNINISNGVDLISNNVDLLELRCSNNLLTSLDLTSNTKLTILSCDSNSINTNIDLSQNGNLEEFNCEYNQIPSLDLNSNTNLSFLDCRNNQLGILDVSQNTALTKLNCADNVITSLDVSLSPNLYFFNCQNNQLSSLNVKNGSNTNIGVADFDATNNPNLTCILVDDAAWSAANWTNIDTTSTFVNDQATCASLSITDNTFETQFSLFPNPVKDSFNIQNKSNYNIENISIYSLVGKMVLKTSKTNSQIDVSNLKTGIYFIKITSKNKTVIQKIIISN